VKKAFDSYKEKTIATGLISLKDGESITDYIDFFSVHLPYRKMGEKALIYLLRHEWRHLPRWKNVINEIGIQEPVQKDARGTIESVLSDTEFMKNLEGHLRNRLSIMKYSKKRWQAHSKPLQ
jgi:hydroxymethylglutaryl-CoA synthase